MGLNWGGFAAAYQGAKEEQRRTADDERRATEAAEAKKDAAYRDETRTRQRTEWKEADRIKADEKNDRAAVNAEFDAKNKAAAVDTSAADVAEAQQAVQKDELGAAITAAQAPPEILPSLKPGAFALDPNAPVSLAAPAAAVAPGSPKLAPAVASKLTEGKAAGIPAAHNFNDSLDRNLEILRRRNARGDLSAEDYAQKTAFLKRAQSEGVSEAVNMLAQGRYEEAMQAYNSVGSMRGARIVKAEQGTTKINGEDVPTHLVTVRNPDGSRTTIDSARAQYQLLDFNTQLSHADRARTFQATQQNHKQDYELRKKEADDARADRAEQRKIQRAALDAGTPAGKLKAAEKALGRPLTEAERAKQLGIDTMPPAMRAQLDHLLKQQDGIATSINKAQAEGTWQEGSPGAASLTTREAILNQKVTDLLASAPGAKGGAAGSDPLGLNTPPPAAGKAAPAAAAPTATAAPASTARAPAVPPVGGVRAPAPAAAAPAAPSIQQRERAIAQAIGLSGNDSMNAIIAQHAERVRSAADQVRAYRDEYIKLTNAGDTTKAAHAQRMLDQANAAYNAAVEGTGNNQDAVRAAVGF